MIHEAVIPSRRAAIVCYGAVLILLALGLCRAANALPKYAKAEKKPCSYCHVAPAGGGARNFRGLYYALHNHTFAAFDEAAEAKKAEAGKPAPVEPPGPDLLKPTTAPGAWDFGQYDGGKGEMSVDGDAVRIAVTKVTGTNWHVQLYQSLPMLANGKTYTLTFRARADRLRSVPVYAQVGAGDHHGIGLSSTVTLSARWKRYVCSFTAANVADAPTVGNLMPSFLLGGETGTVWFADVRLRSGNAETLPDSDPATVPDFGEAQFAGMGWVRIPAGSFVRGTTDAEKDALTKAGVWNPTNAVEQPARDIRITRPFFISQTPVTQAVYKVVMGVSPSAFPGDDLPVDSVTWNDARAFCKALTARSGGKARYRLPTEAEWEYVCRAGSDGQYPRGEDRSTVREADLNEYAWYAANAENRTHPVANRRANAWGVYDMTGNVWQWCEDAFVPDYYAKSPSADPVARDPDATEQVLRGGCWFLDARAQRVTVRGGNVPGFKSPYVGLRIVRE